MAINYPEVGYVQGQSYIASILSKYVTPQDIFLIMVSLFENYGMKEQFLPGFPGLKKDFYILIRLQKKYLPKLYERFVEMEYIPHIYATEWFLTLFAKFPKDVVLRIWDIYFVEGRSTLFRFALAIMNLNEIELLKPDTGNFHCILLDRKQIKKDELLSTALK